MARGDDRVHARRPRRHERPRPGGRGAAARLRRRRCGSTAAACRSSTRSATRRRSEVIALAHAGFLAEFERLGGRERVGEFGADDVVAQLQAGRVPLVLVSNARLHAERVPHWVVATGFGRRPPLPARPARARGRRPRRRRAPAAAARRLRRGRALRARAPPRDGGRVVADAGGADVSRRGDRAPQAPSAR